MEKMIAYCGIVCTECEAYLATQSQDPAALDVVAAKWREQFDSQITAESIRCDGCLATTSQLCSYCAICPIRLCAMERKEDSCAYCMDYASCEKLKGYFEHAPHMKKVLDDMRAGMYLA
ncbi:MAG: DUF3795 domain-containing protein [Anaerolineae bacterium]|nr:DUF3795 domain-containing protein [Anaerolineae bacterium]